MPLFTVLNNEKNIFLIFIVIPKIYKFEEMAFLTHGIILSK